jgi:hypothetical protein
LTLSELAKEIQSPEINTRRARTIARTETIRAANAASVANVNDKGYIVQKKWLAIIDRRTRDDHAELDEKVVEKEASWTFTDKDGVTQKLRYPGDPDAPPEQTINCRCTMVWISSAREGQPKVEKPKAPEPIQQQEPKTKRTSDLQQAQKNQEEWVSKLSIEDKIDFAEYTSNSYQKINGQLRDANNFQEYNFDRLINNLSDNLKNAPKYNGVTYRGLRFTNPNDYNNFINKLKESDFFVEKAFMSTTSDMQVLDKFFFFDKYEVRLKINGKNGVLIDKLSLVQAEKEILFDRNSKFKFVKIISQEYNQQDDVNKILIEISEL